MSAEASRPDPCATALAAEGRAFDEPWQAEAFALAVELHAAGMFSWPEWSQALAAEIRTLAARGKEDYFLCWLNAVESLLVAKGVASRDELASLAAAWGESYRATPHGRPVPAPAASRRA